MTYWEIYPYQGVGILKFNMERGEIHQMLGNPTKSFVKTQFSTTITDSYDELGFHLYYDGSNKLEFVELFNPCRIVYQNIFLLDLDAKQVMEELSSRGIEFSVQPKQTGCILHDEGIALSFSDDEVESVGVYKKGYYDKS